MCREYAEAIAEEARQILAGLELVGLQRREDRRSYAFFAGTLRVSRRLTEDQRRDVLFLAHDFGIEPRPNPDCWSESERTELLILNTLKYISDLRPRIAV